MPYGPPRRTQTLDMEAAGGSMPQKDLGTNLASHGGTECSCETRAEHEAHYLKNYLAQNQRMPPRRAATSKIRLHPFRVNFDISKSPNKYWGILITWGNGYKLFLRLL